MGRIGHQECLRCTVKGAWQVSELCYCDVGGTWKTSRTERDMFCFTSLSR